MRVSQKIKLSLIIFLLLFFTFNGNTIDLNGDKNNVIRLKAKKISATARDICFPTMPGFRWVYHITLGEVEPLQFLTTIWPVDSKEGVLSSLRHKLIPSTKKPADKTFELIIKLKGKTTVSNPLFKGEAMEIEIEKDELGIYPNCQKLFWIINSDQEFTVFELALRSPQSPDAPLDSPGIWQKTNGYAIKPLFFKATPGVYLASDKIPEEQLASLAILNEGIILARVVGENKSEKNKTEMSSSNKGFMEIMIFQRNVGLVYLEQIVDGKISMIWELVESNKIYLI